MPLIELKNIEKNVLKNVNLTVLDKEILVLVGPNGAGKTTLLNVVAGLTEYKGQVFFDGVQVDRLPPHRRGVSYLFQDLALFPHLTVAANIAYGLKVKRYPKETIRRRVLELMEALHITNLKDAYPHSLSGGEKQRVAIARALAPFHKILLLDEPTSALDAQTAKYFRTEMRTLLKRMEITAIFVMHDLLGAEELADRIAILYDGKIEQVSEPKDLFFNPTSEMVSELIGMPNVLNCDESRVLSIGLVEVRCGNMKIVLPHEGNVIKKIAIPPHDIYISTTKPPGPTLNRFKAKIEDITRLRSIARVKVNVNGTMLSTEVPLETLEAMNLAIGQEVYIIIKLRRLRFAES